MVTVVWTKQALNQRRLLYKNGVLEFGVSVAISTAERINSIAENLRKWPTSGFPEPLLKNSPRLYRSKHINKRFKLIYRFEEDREMVYIEDIWDTRRAPQNLVKRIKI